MRVSRQWIRTIGAFIAAIAAISVFIVICVYFVITLKQEPPIEVPEGISLRSEVERIVNDKAYDDKYISEVLIEEYMPWVFDRDSEEIKSMNTFEEDWLSNPIIEKDTFNNYYYLDKGEYGPEGYEIPVTFTVDSLSINNSILYINESNANDTVASIDITNSIVIFDMEEDNYFELGNVTNSIIVFTKESDVDYLIEGEQLFNNSILVKGYESDDYYRGQEVDLNTFIDNVETPM